jgi:hypothetical protein
MDVEAFSRRESMLKLREALLRSEEDRIAGKPGHSVDETGILMRRSICEVVEANNV